MLIFYLVAVFKEIQEFVTQYDSIVCKCFIITVLYLSGCPCYYVRLFSRGQKTKLYNIHIYIHTDLYILYCLASNALPPTPTPFWGGGGGQKTVPAID